MHKKNNNQKLSCVSLFSGAGGMDVGFSKAGFRTLWANDLDTDACASYNSNHETQIVQGDLKELGDSLSTYIGIDLVYGGPPCQGFSVAGKQDPNDKRSKLINTFFDTIELINPNAFVCENVKALAAHKRWQELRDSLVARAHSLGYMTTLIVLNSSRFGTPQNRERMFIIGLKGDPSKSDGFESHFLEELMTRTSEPERVAQIVRKLGVPGSLNNPSICTAKITYAKKPVLRKSAFSGMLFNGSGRPIRADGYSMTISASMGGNRTPIIDDAEVFGGEKNYVVDYYQRLVSGKKPLIGSPPSHVRRMTLEEAAAIQTFPNDYKFSGTKSSIFRQIGNAVPCNMAYAVAESLKSFL